MKRGDLEGRLTTNISPPFRELVLQKAGRPRKYEGSWYSSNKRVYLTELTFKKLSHEEFLQT